MTIQNIIYISGSGRSGSTLLERILHSSSGVSALGELHCLWRLSEAEITCSCGSPFRDDPFWGAVLANTGLDTAAIAEFRRLEGLVCRTGYIARHRFSVEALGADREVQRFLELQFRLFEGIASVSGCPVLVDSSKAGPRAWLLACDPRVRIVHLYRDPADVIASWRSAKFDPGMGHAMKRMSIVEAALDWWKVEQLVCRLERIRPVSRIDYRAFCAAPQEVIGAVLAGLDLRTLPAPHWTAPNAVEQGANYHSLNGNPDRFERGPIEVSARRTDWSKVKAGERSAIQLTASALRALYPGRA